MRNIDKKWTLFIIATVVSFYGIFYTLLNSTFALKYEVPIDSHFDDMNFYKCVVDSYNLEFSMNNSYNEVMDYEKLKKLTILKCNKDEFTLEQEKIVSVKGIELLTSLENVSLAYNNIYEIDLSKNLNLLSLDISYNDLEKVNLSNNKKLQVLNIDGTVFLDNQYVYIGNGINLNNNVDVGSKLLFNEVMWEIKNNNDVIEFDKAAIAKKLGVATLYGKSILGYEVIKNINVINISSDEYRIDHNNEYIYIGEFNEFDIQNIICSDDNITLELHMNNNNLYVKYNDEILKSFELIETIKDA